MREVQPGLWHWEASHPDWKPAADWGPVVWSYAIDDGDRLLLFDPVAQPSLVDELAAGREPVDVLTCPWARSDAQGLVEQLGAQIYVPPPGGPRARALLTR